MVNFRGFFLPKEDKASNEGVDSESDGDSDDDDFENPDYQDIIQIASGKYQSFNTSKTRYVAEKLQEIDCQDGRFVLKGEKIIRARFDSMFSHPWWMVEVFEINTITRSRTQRKELIPSYSIRCDDGIDISSLSLFLTQGCCVNAQHAASFLEFIQTRNLIPTFVHLLKNLREFASSGEVNSEIANQIQTSLSFSATGKAFLVPELTKVAHRLLPQRVTTLFSSVHLELLRNIEKTLKHEPWILGFQHVLKERFGISNCEVKIPSLVNCNLIEKMPVVNRDALYIYNALCKVTYKYGHTYVPLQQLKANKYFQPPFTPQVYQVTAWDESLNYLKEMGVVKTGGDSYGKPSSLFLPQIRRYEQTIVRSICKIMKKRPWVSGLVLDEQVFGGDADQLKAAKMITASPVVVLSGKGGCGKTHVVSTVLSKALKLKRTQFAAAGESCDKQDEHPEADRSQSLSDASQTFSQGCSVPLPASCSSFPHESPLKEENGSQNALLPQCQTERIDPCGDAVLLTAPTGRAASILGKRTDLQSYTLHSVIFSYLRWLKEIKSGERHSAWKFSQVELLVCDESSLISVKTFATLINILMRNSSLQQVILLGDKNQLPSIEPGTFLSDVYNALMPHGAIVTLTTNHRAESQLIVENASRISRQEMPFFPDDPKRGFISLCYQPKQSDDTTESDDDMAITQVVRDLLENKISTVTLPEPEKSQFIAFRRRDCLNINELCARHYNQHSIKDAKGKLDFQVGDKVCVKKNIVCFDVHAKEEVKFCNGEIFFVKEVSQEEDNRNKKTTYFDLDNGEKIMKVDFKMLKKAKLCHAWARTIHTYQGSEIDTVVYVVGSPIYQTCQHVYTAVTRGVRQVIVVSNPRNLEAAVKTKPFTRKTRLQRYLTLDLQKPVSDEEEDAEAAASPSDVDETHERLGINENNVFCNQNLDQSHYCSSFQAASQLFAKSAAGDLRSFGHDIADSSSNAENSKVWQDVFEEEDDDEVLARVLDVESNLQTPFTDAQRSLPTKHINHEKPDKECLGDTSAVGDFHISRSNLSIKQEKRNRRDCLADETSHSAVQDLIRNPGYVTSGDFVAERNPGRAKSKRTDVDAANLGDDLYSLNDLTRGATIPPLSPVIQGSPSANSAIVVGCNSPNIPSGCSVLFTPPQTPTGITIHASLTKRLPDSAPRKRNPPGSAPSGKSGGIPAKGRRRSFTAQFDGWCSVCRGPIRGMVDEITHLQSGSTKSWVHQKCAKSK